MRTLVHLPCLMIALSMMGFVLLAGCANEAPTAADNRAGDGHEDHDHDSGDKHDNGDQDQAAHNLGGWWCTEHGVPEGECTRCDSSLIAGFRDKGDWCDQHARPDSQCFVCHPELKEKFAARYEAKFGEKPPEPAE